MVAVSKVAWKANTICKFNKKINIIFPSLIPMFIKNLIRGSNSSCRNSLTVEAIINSTKVK